MFSCWEFVKFKNNVKMAVIIFKMFLPKKNRGMYVNRAIIYVEGGCPDDIF
jgi:hypothetical protein